MTIEEKIRLANLEADVIRLNNEIEKLEWFAMAPVLLMLAIHIFIY